MGKHVRGDATHLRPPRAHVVASDFVQRHANLVPHEFAPFAVGGPSQQVALVEPMVDLAVVLINHPHVALQKNGPRVVGQLAEDQRRHVGEPVFVHGVPVGFLVPRGDLRDLGNVRQRPGTIYKVAL
jgi:hypothetical protein